jgi:hypothetical protein
VNIDTVLHLAVVKIFPRVLAAMEPFEAVVQWNWRSPRSVVALPMRVAQIALVPTTVVLTTVVVALPARVDRIDRPSVVRIDFPSKVAQTGLPSVVLVTAVVVALPTKVDQIDLPSVVRIDSPSKVAQTDLPSVDLPVVDQIVFPKEKKIVQIPWASDQCLL